MLLVIAPDVPDPISPADSVSFFNGIIAQMAAFFDAIHNFMNSILVGPLTLWQWIISLFVFWAILLAVRLLTGNSGLSITQLFHKSEEGRFHNKDSGGKK